MKSYMKKFNNNRNIVGSLVKKYREEKHYTKTDLSHKLELLGIELDRFELYKIETGKTSVKDFELIGLCIVLDIDFDKLKNLVTDYDTPWYFLYQGVFCKSIYLYI